MPAAQRSGQDYPWQVHIAVNRKVCGAGIMLDGEYVLTCAHVAVAGAANLSSQSADGIRIHFDGRPASTTEFATSQSQHTILVDLANRVRTRTLD